MEKNIVSVAFAFKNGLIIKLNRMGKPILFAFIKKKKILSVNYYFMQIQAQTNRCLIFIKPNRLFK